MTAAQTSVAASDGESLAATGHHEPTFWFEKPSQDELRRRLAALDAARHVHHTQPDRFCPLCPPRANPRTDA